jgi:hypothetical protein
MTNDQAKQLKAGLFEVFKNAIEGIGLPAFKALPFFGSNDPAFLAAKAAKLKKKSCISEVED